MRAHTHTYVHAKEILSINLQVEGTLTKTFHQIMMEKQLIFAECFYSFPKLFFPITAWKQIGIFIYFKK